jgi:hypothetical protein
LGRIVGVVSDMKTTPASGAFPCNITNKSLRFILASFPDWSKPYERPPMPETVRTELEKMTFENITTEVCHKCSWGYVLGGELACLECAIIREAKSTAAMVIVSFSTLSMISLF